MKKDIPKKLKNSINRTTSSKVRYIFETSPERTLGAKELQEMIYAEFGKVVTYSQLHQILYRHAA